MRVQIATSLILITGLTACVNVKKPKPDTEGKSGEVVVYIPEEYRDMGIEEAVDSALEGKITGLYQEEPMFDIEFEKEKTPEKLLSRNLLEIDIAEGNGSEVFTKKEGLNAKDQFHLIIYATSPEDAKRLLGQHASKIRNALNFEEDDRAYKHIRSYRNRYIANTIFEKQKIDILVPEYLNEFIYNSSEFSLVSGYETDYSKTGELIIQQYLFVMQFPDNGDSLNFTKEGLMWSMNGYLKTWAKFNTKRENTDAFMQITNTSSVPFTAKEINFKDMEAMELRGNMSVFDADGESYPFGGYFVGVAARDTDHQRITVALGMVNVPRDFWYREYIRKMRIVVFSMEP